MRILIATGIFPPDVGGPAYYAKSLYSELHILKHDVSVLSYTIEKKMPTGIRHIIFLLKLILHIRNVDLIIALDTYSTGLPAIVAGKIFCKKVFIRVGGDFLWEQYINRTKNKIFLSKFYKENLIYSFKEHIIFILTKYVLRCADAVVFSTKWQKNIWMYGYSLINKNIFIIENFYDKKQESHVQDKKVFLWIGRNIFLKNITILQKVFDIVQKTNTTLLLEISPHISHDAVLKKIKECYAVILPSISEVSPNFILEALTYNKPFIMTKDTGLFDRLHDFGRFINPLDEESIKKEILYLSDSEYYAATQTKIRDSSFTHSYREIAREFIDIYNKLIV